MSTNPIQASIADIFDALTAGKQLVVEFPSASAAETFRVSLHKYKRRQDGHMEDVGIDFDKMVLSYGIAPIDRANTNTEAVVPVRATMCLSARKQSTQYTIISITDAPTRAEIRSNMD